MIYVTAKQKEVLRLLALGYSARKIAEIRGISKNAVYKMLARMEKNGLLEKQGFSRGDGMSTCKPTRVHGLMYQIKILYSSPVYFRLLKNSNILDFDDFKVRLYKKSLSLWILRDFTDKDHNKAYAAAQAFLRKALLFLERRLSLTLVKRGYQNIKEIRAHFSEVNNELAQDYNKTGRKLQVRAPEDNKPWLLIDNSFNLNELEAVHPKTSYEDYDNIRDQFIFMRKNPQLLQTLTAAIEALTESQKINTTQLTGILTLLKISLPGLSDAPAGDLIQTPTGKPEYIG